MSCSEAFLNMPYWSGVLFDLIMILGSFIIGLQNGHLAPRDAIPVMALQLVVFWSVMFGLIVILYC